MLVATMKVAFLTHSGHDPQMVQSFRLVLHFLRHFLASPRFFLPYRKSFFPSTLLRNVGKNNPFNNILTLCRKPGQMSLDSGGWRFCSPSSWDLPFVISCEECYGSAKNRRSSCSTGSGWPPLSVFHAVA